MKQKFEFSFEKIVELPHRLLYWVMNFFKKQNSALLLDEIKIKHNEGIKLQCDIL